MSREYRKSTPVAGVHSVLRGGLDSRVPATVLESPVHDVLFLLLIAALFGLLALCAKGAEKL